MCIRLVLNQTNQGLPAAWFLSMNWRVVARISSSMVSIRFEGSGQAEVRGHRPTHLEAEGDQRRGVPCHDPPVHRQEPGSRQALVRLVQYQPDAHLDSSQQGI